MTNGKGQGVTTELYQNFENVKIITKPDLSLKFLVYLTISEMGISKPFFLKAVWWSTKIFFLNLNEVIDSF
jgi:hypothetical protein